jgi:hypothetical protein
VDVQVAFAWIGLIFTILTLSYWIRIYYAQNQSKKESVNQQYAESMGCFGACVLLGVGLFLLVFALMILGRVFEGLGIPPVSICVGLPVIAVIILIVWLAKR